MNGTALGHTKAEWQANIAETPIAKFELRPHQEEAIEKLDSGKILCGGVGSGKTYTSLAYYFTREAPVDLYVITTAKKRDSFDWEDSAVKFGISNVEGVGFAGKLTVDSWNNIGKYTDVRGAFFIFDEQRVVGTGTWVRAFLQITKRNRWILLSATPGDTWLDYAPVFVANGYYKNVSEFKREHVIYAPYVRYPKVDRYISVNRLVKYRNHLLVDMPYERHTVRHTHIVKVGYNEELMRRIVVNRWNIFENRPLRDAGELSSVMRKLVNTDVSRLETVRTLMKSHPRLIVFYNHNPELEMLRTLESSGVAVAEWNGHKHQPIPDTDRWVYLVQYQSGSEGWNCTTTNSTVFYSLTYSYKTWHQAHGRTDRLDTPYTDLHYYVLRSNSPIDQAVWRALSHKKNFNERDLKL
jgi:hypothetical protein